MELRLNFDQRARLELIAIHSGLTTEQLLLEAAQSVLDRDAAETAQPSAPHTQRFLSDVELQARFDRLLEL
jgi:hypothetical protein